MKTTISKSNQEALNRFKTEIALILEGIKKAQTEEGKEKHRWRYCGAMGVLNSLAQTSRGQFRSSLEDLMETARARYSRM